VKRLDSIMFSSDCKLFLPLCESDPLDIEPDSRSRSMALFAYTAMAILETPRLCIAREVSLLGVVVCADEANSHFLSLFTQAFLALFAHMALVVLETPRLCIARGLFRGEVIPYARMKLSATFYLSSHKIFGIAASASLLL